MLAAVLVLLVLFSVVAGYFQALTGMASYDDEGTLIRWVREVISGQPLYDRIQTPYDCVDDCGRLCPQGSDAVPKCRSADKARSPSPRRRIAPRAFGRRSSETKKGRLGVLISLPCDTDIIRPIERFGLGFAMQTTFYR